MLMPEIRAKPSPEGTAVIRNHSSLQSGTREWLTSECGPHTVCGTFSVHVQVIGLAPGEIVRVDTSRIMGSTKIQCTSVGITSRNTLVLNLE